MQNSDRGEIVFNFIQPLPARDTQEVAESGRGFDSSGELNQFKPAMCRFTCAKIKKLFKEKLQETCPGLVENTEEAEKKLQEILEEVIGESGAKRQEVETIVREKDRDINPYAFKSVF